MARTYRFEHYKVRPRVPGRRLIAREREHLAQTLHPLPPLGAIAYGARQTAMVQRARLNALKAQLDAIAAPLRRPERPPVSAELPPAPPLPKGIPIGALPPAPLPVDSWQELLEEGEADMKQVVTATRALTRAGTRLARFPYEAGRRALERWVLHRLPHPSQGRR